MSATANYMLSHSMDDENGNGAQNLSCQGCEWADSSIDARHVFTSNFAYEMPFARGNPLLGDSTTMNAVRRTVPNWATTGFLAATRRSAS